MDIYKVVGSFVNIHSGIVRLTGKQANRREHALEPMGKGEYRIMTPIQFKLNEKFGYNGAVGKELAVGLEKMKKPGPKKKEEVPEDNV